MQQNTCNDSNELNNEEDLNRKCAPTSKRVKCNKKDSDEPRCTKTASVMVSEKKEIKIRDGDAGRARKSSDIDSLVPEARKEISFKEAHAKRNSESETDSLNEREEEMCSQPKENANSIGPSKYPYPPKRPMSAFLAYANKRRAGLKRKNPQATNGDLSKMLSKTWKELPLDIKSKYVDEEYRLREKYKREMADWRKQVAQAKKAAGNEQQHEPKKKEHKTLKKKQAELQQQTELQQRGTSRSVASRNTLLPAPDFNYLVSQSVPLTHQSNLQVAAVPPSSSTPLSIGLNNAMSFLGQSNPYENILNGYPSLTNAYLQELHNIDVLQAASREISYRNLAMNQMAQQHDSILAGIIGGIPRGEVRNATGNAGNQMALLENMSSRQNQLSSIPLVHQGLSNTSDNRNNAYNLRDQDYRILELLRGEGSDNANNSNIQSSSNRFSGS